MKFRTTNRYNYKSNKYKRIARNTNKAFKAWKKDHPQYTIIDVSRQIYRDYATLGITFKDSRGVTSWVNVFC